MRKIKILQEIRIMRERLEGVVVIINMCVSIFGFYAFE